MDHVDMHNDPLRYRDSELEDPTTSLVPAVQNRALGTVPIDDIVTRSQLIRELTKHIPLNEYGLPQYYYRPDLLDVEVVKGSMKRGEATFVDDLLQSATVQIEYSQGFPSLNDATPLWGELPFEPKEAYAAFLAYCEQEGIRTIHEQIAWPKEQLLEWFNLYYWPSRAKALDMFKSAHHQRLREQRIMSLEGNHFLEGEKIFKRLVAAIGNKTNAELDEMDVDKLITSLERVSKIQRAAVGIDGKAHEATSKTTSVEVVMRQHADAEGRTAVEDEFDMTLLQDPDMLKQAQELIIKVNK